MSATAEAMKPGGVAGAPAVPAGGVSAEGAGSGAGSGAGFRGAVAFREDRSSRLGRRDYVVALLMALLAAAATSDAWADMVGYGIKDEESSHVLLVPVSVIWIVLVRKGALARCPRQGTVWGAVIAAVGLALWAGGYRYDVQVAWHGGAVLMTLGAAATALGTQVLVRLWPAVLALAMLVPIPATGRLYVARPMQEITARVAAETGQVLGMDVVRQGYDLQVKGEAVTVAEACNGMRMVFTLLLACYVFAFTTPLYNGVRLLVVLASPVVAIVANVVRLIPTLWVYGEKGHELGKLFHDLSGWAMLLLAFVALMGIINLLRWLSIPVSPRGVYAR